MVNKTRLVILILVIFITLLTFFTLAGAAIRSEGDLLAYLPMIINLTGSPEPTVTFEPPTATPTQEPTLTPTPTATPVINHFDDCAFRTGNNATVAVPVNVAINGELILTINDEIAIFTPDGSICAGMALWSGENIAITAWGDDNQTEEIDGLRDGETMTFRIWDESANVEVQVKEVAYSVGDGIYTTNGIFVVSVFTLK